MKVPLVDLRAQHRAIKDDVLAAATAVIDSQSFILGETVAAFERALAAMCGVTNAVGVASGTDALALSLRALGIGAGDSVITPAFGFVASAEVIAAIGATPVFADVDATFGMTAASIDAVMTPRVKAILPVHLFGQCTDMEPMTARGVAVVEDAAQAIGATDRGRAAGSIGDAGALSFFPSKNLGAWGDGGAVVTSRDDVAARVKRLRAHGMSAPYVSEEIGVNSRLDALQAAVLGAKARHLPAWNAARNRVAKRYRERLQHLAPRLVLPVVRAEATHVYHQFVVRTAARDDLQRHLASREIESRVYYPVPIHRQRCFAHLAPAACPFAEEASRTVLALPMYAELADDAIDWVCDAIEGFFAR